MGEYVKRVTRQVKIYNKINKTRTQIITTKDPALIVPSLGDSLSSVMFISLPASL